MAKKKQTVANNRSRKKTSEPKKDIREVAAQVKNERNEQIQRWEQLVENELTSRSKLFSHFTDPRRDIDSECGYPETKDIKLETYRHLYDREAYATRVVELLPEESWVVSPTITEDGDIEVTTPFEADWQSLNEGLAGPSWHKQEEDSLVWNYLKRVDILSGIGTYGVILLGLDDGKDLTEPVDGFEKGEPSNPTKEMGLTFLRVLDQSLATISSVEKNTKNPRFGQPTAYSLTLEDPDNLTLSAGVDVTTSSQTLMNVHWSRIVHIADKLGSSELYAIPRQKPVLNNLLNLRKVLGSSAEMYYKGAFPGLSFETHPQLGGDVQIDTEAMKSMIEEYQNGLQRALINRGIAVKSLAPQVVDPTTQLKAQIEALCVQLGCPIRIFLGSERGELASSQDTRVWNKRIRARQHKYLTPRVITKFIDRLILLGVLTEPTEKYSVDWPDLDTLSMEELATVAQKRTESMVKYVQGSGEALIHPLDYLVSFLGMPIKEAEAMLENVTPQEKLIEDDTEGDVTEGNK